MKTAIANGKVIDLKFDFDMDIINQVREITGRKWDDKNKKWTIPLSAWHCSKVIELLAPFDFTFDNTIKNMADRSAPIPLLEYPAGLYPFQKEAVNFIIKTQGRCIIADEMGLGKTIEALAYAKLFSTKLLIIAPANVIFKWEVESKKWNPDRSVSVYTSGKGELNEEDIHIMSYNIMSTRYDELKEAGYDTVIFDEAHMIKNSKAIRTRVARALVKNINSILFLSGTPFMNKPSEIFPLLNMLDSRAYSNFFQFATRYCGAQYISGMWYFPPGVITNVEELTERLSTIMIRRTKKSVLKDLPDLTRTSVPVSIHNLKEYREALKDIKSWLKTNDKTTLDPNNVLTRLNTLRQIIGDGKTAAAIELAESVLQDGKKVVLFAHHKKVVEILMVSLQSYGVGTITGDVKPKDRQKKINDFLMLDSKMRVMIITVAGAEGIDLFSASDIIFAEREWTPAREEQAESRLHRNGQKNPVNAWYIVATGTIDEKFDKLIREKRKMFQQVITSDVIAEAILEGL